ncbi:hypothetical protein ACS0TY_015173 [Phlomoides rotata]
MESSLTSINPLTIFILTGVLLLTLFFFFPKKPSKAPPGPKGIPILGNLLQLGDLPHQTMQKWSKTYGPVIWLKIGAVNTVVVQSAAAAAELFKRHDLPFAGRTSNDVLTVFDFNQAVLGLLDFGGYWRVLRRLSTTEMFVSKRINEMTEVRHRLRDNMERWIVEASDRSRAEGGNGEVQVGHYLFLLAFNLVGNLVLSRDLFNPKNPEAREFFDCMTRVMQIAGKPNISDSLPWLKWMDLAGLKRKMEKDMGVTLRILHNFMQERIDDRKAGKFRDKKDYLDVLLDYQGDGAKHGITEKNINLHLNEMFFAGSETMGLTMEWGFTELMRNPEKFKKLREELDRVVGLNRRVEEGDMESLAYLQVVVKETLRLHPPLPMLLPRKTMEDVNYLEYTIPKGTQVLVNAWAIGRDPNSWEDPLVFKPERFFDVDVEYKGQHFNFIPFGSGRRICPGLPWAHRVVPLAIATLVHSFDWDLGPGVRPEDIDREERLGLTVGKKRPLFVIPKRRLNI